MLRDPHSSFAPLKMTTGPWSHHYTPDTGEAGGVRGQSVVTIKL